MRIFFATDIHGSEVCWRKFLQLRCVLQGRPGHLGRGSHGQGHGADRREQRALRAHLRRDGASASRPKKRSVTSKRQIRNRGFYPTRISAEELSALNEEDGSIDRRFTTEMVHTLDRWLDMADSKLDAGKIPCFLNGGNDDTFDIDQVIEDAPHVNFTEGKVMELDGFYLASMGYTNPTPWNTFREESEVDLGSAHRASGRQDSRHGSSDLQLSRAALQLGPRRGAGARRDASPKHGGAVMEPVGSKAVARRSQAPADALGARAYP